jgi:hypothetical protein
MSRRCHECLKWTPNHPPASAWDTGDGWGRCGQTGAQVENVDHACEHFEATPRTVDELMTTPGPWELEVLPPCPRWGSVGPPCTCRYCCYRALAEAQKRVEQ